MTFLCHLFLCLCLVHFITCTCKHGAKPCEWEPWQPWSSCSRTCGVGYRTRNRNLCCGPILSDCASVCYRGDNNKQVEVCNDSCPNGGSLVDDICQCPPLKYGICCELDESEEKVGGKDCARHCTWINWNSWGDCSTSCGCGTRERTRELCCSREILNNGTLCADDCNMTDTDNTRSCTKLCSSKSGPNGCSLCSWNNWGSWSSCNSSCGGGQRSRSRSPCCCSGQTIEDCLADCGLSIFKANQKESCNQHCFHGGSFINNKCACDAGFEEQCCSREVMAGKCKKCSWKVWQAWEETGEDGKMRRKRELCCRIGQSAEGCRSECRVEEHSQVQILLNAEKHLDNQTLTNTTTAAKLESTDIDPYLFLYAGVVSLASVIVTSLVWVGCYYLKKKRRASKDKETRSDSPPEHDYEMSSNCEGVDQEHYYDSVNTGYINNDSGGIYENHSYKF